jgi:hypothetical protein
MVKEKVRVHGYYVERFSDYLGRVLTQVEALGLPPSQEKAFKSIVKNELWYLWDHAPFSEDKVLEFGKGSAY